MFYSFSKGAIAKVVGVETRYSQYGCSVADLYTANAVTRVVVPRCPTPYQAFLHGLPTSTSQERAL
jgi:hypothetical protein